MNAECITTLKLLEQAQKVSPPLALVVARDCAGCPIGAVLAVVDPNDIEKLARFIDELTADHAAGWASTGHVSPEHHRAASESAKTGWELRRRRAEQERGE